MYATAALLALAVSSVTAVGPNTAAKAAGKLYFGTAVDNGDLGTSAYTNEEKNTDDFGQVTPANSMKWDSIEPSRGQFSYSGGDTIANLAASNGQLLRCHNLVWHNQLPNWVSSGNFDNATLISIMKNHIANEVTHYKGKCYAWDVVNEAINDDNSGTLRSDPFHNTIGAAYLPIAFATAHQYDPNAKLYYNDYNIEYPSAKTTAAINLVKMIQSYGAPIDGVGLQSHFIAGQTPSTSTQAANMKSFTDLGVDVAITELDIRVPTPESSASLTQQATDYGNTIAACVQTKRCVGVTLWDWNDKDSWVPGVFPGYGAATPWDSNFQKKTQVYNAIVAAFQAGGTTSPSSSTTKATTTAVSTTKVSTTLVTTTSSAPTGGSCSAQWGQCGGSGWNGPTCCVSGTTCKYSNAYYSQCL